MNLGIIAGCIAALIAGYVFSLYVWPWAPCRWCGGTGRNAGSNSRRHGDCRFCNRTGRRQRLGSKAVRKLVRSARRR